MSHHVRTPARVAKALFALGTLVLSASLAAAISHLAIDAAGDYLLSHDAYDHIAHHSRFVTAVCAAVFGVISLVLLIAAGLKDARAYRGALRALVDTAACRPAWQLHAAVASCALVILMAMETFDTLWVSGRFPNVADAVGGSLPLGIGITVCVASLLCVALVRALKIVGTSHYKIAAALERLLTRREQATASHAPSFDVIAREIVAAPESILACRSGKRAPPPLFA